jgi:hypothetical protein
VALRPIGAKVDTALVLASLTEALEVATNLPSTTHIPEVEATLPVSTERIIMPLAELILALEALAEEAAIIAARKGRHIFSRVVHDVNSVLTAFSFCSHMKADCPEPRIMRCRHCNQEGHTMRNCPDPTCPPQEPREFTGECRACGQTGHRAIDCPDKPPAVCANCTQEGKSGETRTPFYQD